MSTTPVCWLNGRTMPLADAHIAPNDRGFLLADGLFETMLVLDGGLVRLKAHLARLAAGAGTLRIPLPYATDALAAACHETLAANGLRDTPRASLRLTLTRGTGARGLALPDDPQPTILITAAPGAAPPASLRLATTSVRRVATSPASCLKTLGYTDNVLARAEAADKGAEDALLLSEAGGIACTSAGNIFAVIDGKLVTPPDDGAILPGIARADVLRLAADLGIPCEERAITKNEAAKAAELFVTNSLIGVCPASELDGRPLEPGPVTTKLAQELESTWASET